MFLKQLLRKDGNVNTAVIRRDKFKNSEMYQKILNTTKILDFLNPSISQRIRYIIDGYDNIPLCEVCKINPCVFNKNSSELFRRTCSRECGSLIVGDNSRVGEINKTTINKYKKILFNNYKSNNYILLSKSKILKFIEYLIEKTNNGRKRNWLYKQDYEKYNDLLCSILFLTKYISVENINFNFTERMYLIKNNCNRRPVCSICSLIIGFNGFVQGYSDTCDKCSHIKAGYNRIYNHFNKIKYIIEKNGFDVITNVDKFNGLNYQKIKLKHHKCNRTFEKSLKNGKWNNIICPFCNKYNGKSSKEDEVVEFVKSFYPGEILTNQRMLKGRTKYGRKEIDIYIPEFKIGIEYNGMYWHSNKRKQHFEKFKLCKDVGIQLIQVNGFEWESQLFKNILQNYLQQLMNKNEKIYGRKCQIKEVTNNISIPFLTENHFQGSDNSKIQLGLYYENEIISIMTFGKPRFNKKFEWEMYRYASYKTVLGGKEKLFNHFIKLYNPKNIISYSKNDLFSGQMYKTLGFNFLYYSDPNYIWWKGIKIMSRYQTQKHKLKTVLKLYDETLSENENMTRNRYMKYYDSGNSVWDWESKSS